MCVAFDGDNGETSTYLNREAVTSETRDAPYKRVHRYKYNESFSPTFTFVKTDFGNFTMDEVRQVLKWLTSMDTTSVLDVYYDDSDAVSWSAIGGWTEINTYKLANNRTVGITAVFEAVTPYALSGIHTITKTITDPSDNKITIEIDSDESNMAVYPKLTIQQNGVVVKVLSALNSTSNMVYDTVYYDGKNYYWKPKSEQYVFKTDTVNPDLSTTSVRLTNQHVDAFNKSHTFDSVIVKNNAGTEKVIIDGANKVISSSNTSRVFGDNFNWNWLALYDGSNEITVEGNCTITIEYRTPIKCGEF
jgi:hypothetical protein